MDPDLCSKYLQPMTVDNDLLSDCQTDNYQCEIINFNEQNDCIEATLVFISTTNNTSFFEKLCDVSSNYFKILHVFSYIRRFLFICRNPRAKQSGPLSLEEIRSSENRLILFSQESLKNKAVMSGNLLCLTPFTDIEVIVHVEGRIGKVLMNRDILPFFLKISQIQIRKK